MSQASFRGVHPTWSLSITEGIEMADKKYCRRDVLQGVISAYSDVFDENQRRTKISLGDEVEICGNFSSRIPFQITALNGDVGKYAIPCYDRLSKRINLLRGCGEIIDKSIQEIPDNADSRIIMILESPGRCEYSNVVPGKETIRPQPANVETGGASGRNILNSFVPSLVGDKFDMWRIGLINPIQYSCSLGGKLSTERKNEVFTELFQTAKFRKDFVRRLDIMCQVDEFLVINCCTSLNSILVDAVLKDKEISFIKMAHPSSHCFIRQCKENTSKNCNCCCKTVFYKPDSKAYISFDRTLSIDMLINAIQHGTRRSLSK